MTTLLDAFSSNVQNFLLTLFIFFFHSSDGLHRIIGALTLMYMYNKLGGHAISSAVVTFDLNVILQPADCNLAQFLSVLLIKSLSCDRGYKIGFNTVDAMRALLTVIDLLPEREELVLLDELMKALFSFIASSEYLQLLGTYLPRDKDGYDQICKDLIQLQSERKSERVPHVALEEESHDCLFTLECNEFEKFFKECVQWVVELFPGKKGCCLMNNLDSFWKKWVELQENPNVKYPQWTKEKRIEVTAFQLSDIFYQLWSYSIVKCMGSAMAMLPQPTMELLGFRAGELIIQGRFSHDQLIESFVAEADGTITILPRLHYSTYEGSIKWSSKVNGHVTEILHRKEDANSLYLLSSTALLSFVDKDSSDAVNGFLQQNHDTDNLLIVYSWLSFHCMLIEWSISTDSRSKITIDKKNGVACLSRKHFRCVFGNRSRLLACLSTILPGTIEWIVRSGQEQEGSNVLTFSGFNNRIADILQRPLIVNDFVSVGCKVSCFKPITTLIHSSKTSRIASCISQVILIQLLYTPTKKAENASKLLEDLFQLDFPELGILDTTSNDKQRGFGVNIFRELLDGVDVEADILNYCSEKLSEAVRDGREDEFFLLHSEPDSQDEENIESDSDDSETFMSKPTTATGKPAAAAEAANKTGSDENHNENNGNGDETSLKRQSEDNSGTSAPPRKKARSNSGPPQQKRMTVSIIGLISFVISGRKIEAPGAEIKGILTGLGATISDDPKEFIEKEAENFQKRLEATIIKTGFKSGLTISKDDSDESDLEESIGGGGGTAGERSSDEESDSDESAGARSSDEESDSEESSGEGGGTAGARSSNSGEKGSDATHKAAISSSPEKRFHGKGKAMSPGKGKMPVPGNQDSSDDSDSDDESSPPEKRFHGKVALSPGKGKGKDDESSPPEKRFHGKGKGENPSDSDKDSNEKEPLLFHQQGHSFGRHQNNREMKGTHQNNKEMIDFFSEHGVGTFDDQSSATSAEAKFVNDEQGLGTFDDQSSATSAKESFPVTTDLVGGASSFLEDDQLGGFSFMF